MVAGNIDHLQSKMREDLKKVEQRDPMTKTKVALALGSGLKGRVMVRSEEMAEVLQGQTAFPLRKRLETIALIQSSHVTVYLVRGFNHR